MERHLGFPLRPVFVLRLLAAVDLRVAQRVGQEQVVFHAIAVVVGDVLAEVAMRVFHLPQSIANCIESNDVGGEDVGTAPQLAPGLFIPDFAVAPLTLEVFARAGQEPGQAASVAGVRRNEGHLIPVMVRVLQVIDAGQFVDHAGHGRVAGYIRNLGSIEPDLPIILEALQVARAGHGAPGRLNL